MTSIVHIFTANRHHLVPDMVKTFDLYLSEFNQIFILIGNKEENEKVYNFETTGEIVCLNSIKEIDINNLKFEKIVLHGVPYSWMFYFVHLKVKNIYWVCWGAGAKINYRNFRSILFHPFKILLYSRFKKIAALMYQDKQSLEKNFFLQNVEVLSYFDPSLKAFPFTVEDLSFQKEKYHGTIYVGNNSSSLFSYAKVLEILKEHKNIERIDCMANYNFTENNAASQLRLKGIEYFGDKFTLNTQFYSLDEYYDYMKQCDIYICAVEKQTGLAAIYTTLRMGKKIFLTGHNYEWINSMGCKIFHLRELINIRQDELFLPLSEEEKIQNYNVISKFLESTAVRDNWIEFLA